MPFYNIFSKKEKELQESQSSPEKTKILIDNHEKNSLVASELSKLGFPIEFRHLQVADYLVNNTAIERKTLADLQQSIIDKRIFSQLKEIKQYPKYLLLIEKDNQKEIYRNILHENALRGFFLSTALEAQVPLIFTQNEKETALYLSVLAKRTDKEFSLRPSKIAFSKEEQQQFILEGFPNIGPVTAKKLLAHFKTLKNIFNASKEELEEILGKKAEDFKKLLEYLCQEHN